MKEKLLVYGGALGVVGGILLVTFLLFQNVGVVPPEPGTMRVEGQGNSAMAFQQQAAATVEAVKTEEPKLSPQEAGEQAPAFVLDPSLVLSFEGGSSPWRIHFYIYNQQGDLVSEASEAFVPPEEPGQYLICEEVAWGNEKNHVIMEYYFWLTIP